MISLQYYERCDIKLKRDLTLRFVATAFAVSIMITSCQIFAQVAPSVGGVSNVEVGEFPAVINGSTDKVLPVNITVGEFPTAVAVNPNTNKIYVVNSRTDTISVMYILSRKVKEKTMTSYGATLTLSILQSPCRRFIRHD
jgi:hypothetical protein